MESSAKVGSFVFLNSSDSKTLVCILINFLFLHKELFESVGFITTLTNDHYRKCVCLWIADDFITKEVF